MLGGCARGAMRCGAGGARALRPTPTGSARSRPAIVPLAALVGALLVPALLPAQVFDPAYRLHFTAGVSGAPGATVALDCLLDCDPTADPLAGWSIGVCHDPAAVAVAGATPGSVLGTLQNGQPVDFLVLDFEPAVGIVHGVVICFSACSPLLPPVTDLPLFTADYTLLGAPGSTTLISTCDTVAVGGNPNPVPTIVVNSDGSAREPIEDPAVLTVVDPIFRRGDCGGDGSVSIADAIFHLGVLFGPGSIPCADACDGNDDGMLNIADPVSVLTYLFAGGAPPVPPFPACGADPTEDGLGCGTAPSGC